MVRAFFALASGMFATFGTTTRAGVFALTLPAASRAATWNERASFCEKAPMSTESVEEPSVCASVPFT